MKVERWKRFILFFDPSFWSYSSFTFSLIPSLLPVSPFRFTSPSPFQYLSITCWTTVWFLSLRFAFQWTINNLSIDISFLHFLIFIAPQSFFSSPFFRSISNPENSNNDPKSTSVPIKRCSIQSSSVSPSTSSWIKCTISKHTDTSWPWITCCCPLSLLYHRRQNFAPSPLTSKLWSFLLNGNSQPILLIRIQNHEIFTEQTFAHHETWIPTGWWNRVLQHRRSSATQEACYQSREGISYTLPIPDKRKNDHEQLQRINYRYDSSRCQCSHPCLYHEDIDVRIQEWNSGDCKNWRSAHHLYPYRRAR